MFIAGFGLAGYRSYGEQIQKIGPCRKINLFIGQNNCGKSNLLLFLKRRYSQFITSSASGNSNNLELDPLEFSQNVNPPRILFSVGTDPRTEAYKKLLQTHTETSQEIPFQSVTSRPY